MIYHVNVQISNRQRTQEWYEQMLGAEFLDRGPINPRQLQLRSGTGEMHFTETSEPVAIGHFAVEIDDWDGNVIELVYHPLGLEDVDGKRGGASRHLEEAALEAKRRIRQRRLTR